jgi:hypothetical protein
VPESFKQEIKEYLGQEGDPDEDAKYIGREFGSIEKEDIMQENQFDNMQEMANAPFGKGQELTRE